MKLLLTILPSKELQTKLNNYRKRYDPNYIHIQPHVHFYPAFFIEDDYLPTLTKELETFFAEQDAFTLEILRFSSLSPVENLIYCKLQESLFYYQATSFLDSINYITKESAISKQPHITVASNLSNDEHSDLLGRVKLLSFSETELVREVTLMQQQDNQKWVEVATFTLK